METEHWAKLESEWRRRSLHVLSDTTTVCFPRQLGGGPVQGLVEALQSLGLTEGVRLLRHTELQDDKHSTGNKHTWHALTDSQLSFQKQTESFHIQTHFGVCFQVSSGFMCESSSAFSSMCLYMTY